MPTPALPAAVDPVVATVVADLPDPGLLSFAALGLSPALVAAAAEAGWTAVTPIQAGAVPAILQGHDLLATAPTGSGKTAAFVLPLLQRLLADPVGLSRRPRLLRALILAPTRELALQTGAVLQGLARSAAPQLKTVVAVGGLSINPQLMALRGGAQLVVATPGRLLDLLDHNALSLADLDLLVLDEADRLLDLGFAAELGRLLAALPAERQSLLFSATLPPAVATLAGQLLRQPLRLDLGADGIAKAGAAERPQGGGKTPAAAAGLASPAALASHSRARRRSLGAGSAPPRGRSQLGSGPALTHEAGVAEPGADGGPHRATDTQTDPLAAGRDAESAAKPAIHQRAILVDSARRTPLLRHLINTEGWDRVLVFVASQYASEHVADKLKRAGLQAAALHGKLSQGRRTQVLADFQAGRLKVLVATDLAARGIDVVGLAVVVNHDLARSAVDHTHRIGRTGRAGASGLALSFILADAPGSEPHFRLVEKRQGQHVPREQVLGFEPAALGVDDAAGQQTGDADFALNLVPALGPAGAAPADPNGGIKGRRKSKKDKLREAAAAAAAATSRPTLRYRR